MGNSTQKRRWSKLQNKLEAAMIANEPLKPFLAKIDGIDNATIWQPTEPQWWLEMMAERRRLVSLLEKGCK